MSSHGLSDDQLRAVARGTGCRTAIKELVESRVSRNLLLLTDVVNRRPTGWGRPDAAISTLASTQIEDARTYRELVGDPLVGSWLHRAARNDHPLEREFLHLGNLAVAAAVRLGLDCRVTVWANDGGVTIPTLGTAVMPAVPSGPLEFVVTRGEPRLDEGSSFLPMRRLRPARDDPRFTVRIEDANPYRDGYHAPPSDRLTDAEYREWQKCFAAAWELITGYLHPHAVEIPAGLRVVVPLVDGGDGSSRSGTARESIGAMGATHPASPADFAVTVVHEFQHSKLSALLDLTPLYRLDGTELHTVPWRPDPRPTSGLIQGVYAFLAVAEAWQSFRAIPELAETATNQFRELRGQVDVGYRALATSRELTPAGIAFADEMRPRLDRLLSHS